MSEQKYVVNGINNDKIELVSNYDVRKLNRLLDAKDKMWLAKVKQAREEIDKLDTKIAIRDTPQGRESYFIVDQAEVLKILDKLIAESEGK